MRVKLEAGAKLDFVSPEELRETMEAQTEKIIRALVWRPLLRDVPTQDRADAAGVVDLIFGVPPVGQLWDVRRLVVTGIDPLVATTFTAARLYVGEVGNPRSLVDLFTSAAGGVIPNVGYYGTDQVPVQSGDTLTLRLTGVAASTDILGTALFLQRDRPSEEPTVGGKKK